MLILDVEIKAEQAQAYFDYAGFHVRSMTSPFRMIAWVVQEHVEQQFNTEGMHLSGGWPELAESTKSDRGDDGHPILDDTGQLRRDVTANPARGAEFGGGLRYGNGWLTFNPESWRGGEDPVDLVEAHAEGRDASYHPTSKRVAGGMPSRPVWETPAEFDVEMNAILSNWLDELKRTNVRRRGLDIPRPDGLGADDFYSWEIA
jgi:hypothetical protein